MITIDIVLHPTYYEKGLFNIVKDYSDLFAPNNVPIEINLQGKESYRIYGYINRTANKNGTPRIMGGKSLSDWIQNNFKQGEIMKVGVLTPVSIRLSK